MEKLKLKHLSPYLPYGLNIANKSINKSEGILSIYEMEINNNNDCGIENVLFGGNQMPILRPLSDLTKEIEHNGERFVFSDIYLSNTTIKKILGQEYSTFNNFLNDVDYNSIQLLLKYHFDIFSLIEKGLAIDINTLE